MSDSPVSDHDPAREHDKEKTNGGKSVAISRWLLAGLGLILLVFAVGVGALVTKLDNKDKLATPGPASSSAVAGVANNKGATPARSASTPTAAPSPTPDPAIKVYVTGEVVSPGVYVMQSGDRLIDAINRAGGFTDQADQSRLDQALRVKDEMRVDVPRLATPGTAVTGTSGAGPTTLVSGPAAVTAPAGDGKVNVNTATAAELDKLLPGIGPTLAQRLVDYRTGHGPYKTLDDLRKVQGLSKSVVDKIKDLISF